MADAKVDALRDEVNRRFGTIEKALGAFDAHLNALQDALAETEKKAHNELSQARREERDANAETVQAGVGQAQDVAASEANERVAELREEVRAAFDTLGNAAQDAI